MTVFALLMYFTDRMIPTVVRQTTTMLLLGMALIDASFPGLCHEGDAQMAVAAHRPPVSALWSDETSTSDTADSHGVADHFDHCFCCCRHFLAAHSPHFGFSISRPETPLQETPFVPEGTTASVFHPPRLS